MTWPHPLTHPFNDPPTHPPMGGVSLQIINLQADWIISIRSRFIKFLVIWPEITHWPTEPPIHPPMDRDVSTNNKSSNRIELSQLGQDLFNC